MELKPPSANVQHLLLEGKRGPGECICILEGLEDVLKAEWGIVENELLYRYKVSYV
jgi:hypothetical protein